MPIYKTDPQLTPKLKLGIKYLTKSKTPKAHSCDWVKLNPSPRAVSWVNPYSGISSNAESPNPTENRTKTAIIKIQRGDIKPFSNVRNKEKINPPKIAINANC